MWAFSGKSNRGKSWGPMSLKAKHWCGSAGPISEPTGPELTYSKCLLYGLWPLPSPLCLWGQGCWAPRKQAAGGKWIMGSKLVRRKLNWKVLFLVSSNGENSHGNSLSGRWDQESHCFSSTDAKHHWEWWTVGCGGVHRFHMNLHHGMVKEVGSASGWGTGLSCQDSWVPFLLLIIDIQT